MLDGVVEVTAGSETVELHADDFAYIPPHIPHIVKSASGAGLVLYERRYALKVKWTSTGSTGCTGCIAGVACGLACSPACCPAAAGPLRSPPM